MPKPPAKSSAKSTAKLSDKQDRLARALRANLKRRKAQSRAKADAQAPAGTDDEAAPGERQAGSAPRPRPNMAQKGA